MQLRPFLADLLEYFYKLRKKAKLSSFAYHQAMLRLTKSITVSLVCQIPAVQTETLFLQWLCRVFQSVLTPSHRTLRISQRSAISLALYPKPVLNGNSDGCAGSGVWPKFRENLLRWSPTVQAIGSTHTAGLRLAGCTSAGDELGLGTCRQLQQTPTVQTDLSQIQQPTSCRRSMTLWHYWITTQCILQLCNNQRFSHYYLKK